MKILVTGGSGFLGTRVRGLLGADDLSRRNGRDILDPQDLTGIGDYDMVVHLAADLDKRPESADEVFRTNVDGTVNILREMRDGAVFIFASTKDVYGRFADNFAEVPETCQTLYSGQTALEWSKLIAERYVEYYSSVRNFRSCIFRLSTVYAPMSEGNTPNFVTYFADAINKGERIRIPGRGTGRRDLLHVHDLARACTLFRDSVIRRGLYNLGGGIRNTLSVNDLIKKLEEVSGLQAVIDDENRLPEPVPLDYVSDLSLVSQELGWSPEIGLDDGLKTLF